MFKKFNTSPPIPGIQFLVISSRPAYLKFYVPFKIMSSAREQISYHPLGVKPAWYLLCHKSYYDEDKYKFPISMAGKFPCLIARINRFWSTLHVNRSLSTGLSSGRRINPTGSEKSSFGINLRHYILP